MWSRDLYGSSGSGLYGRLAVRCMGGSMGGGLILCAVYAQVVIRTRQRRIRRLPDGIRRRARRKCSSSSSRSSRRSRTCSSSRTTRTTTTNSTRRWERHSPWAGVQYRSSRLVLFMARERQLHRRPLLSGSATTMVRPATMVPPPTCARSISHNRQCASAPPAAGPSWAQSASATGTFPNRNLGVTPGLVGPWSGT